MDVESIRLGSRASASPARAGPAASTRRRRSTRVEALLRRRGVGGADASPSGGACSRGSARSCARSRRTSARSSATASSRPSGSSSSSREALHVAAQAPADAADEGGARAPARGEAPPVGAEAAPPPAGRSGLDHERFGRWRLARRRAASRHRRRRASTPSGENADVGRSNCESSTSNSVERRVLISATSR